MAKGFESEHACDALCSTTNRDSVTFCVCKPPFPARTADCRNHPRSLTIPISLDHHASLFCPMNPRLTSNAYGAARDKRPHTPPSASYAAYGGRFRCRTCFADVPDSIGHRTHSRTATISRSAWPQMAPGDTTVGTTLLRRLGSRTAVRLHCLLVTPGLRFLSAPRPGSAPTRDPPRARACGRFVFSLYWSR
jgi:hypothetical protein